MSLANLRPQGLLAAALLVGTACAGIDAPVAGDAYLSVAAGDDHSCALTDVDQVLCWGDNAAGQLGVDVGPYASTPRVVFLGPFQARGVVAGGDLSCALIEGGRPQCWGNGGSTPVPIPGHGEPLQVAVGEFGCVLESDGTVGCWERPGDAVTPVALTGTATELAVGGTSACAVLASDAGVVCWSALNVAPTLQDSTAGLGLHSLTKGWGHTCALGADGAARCWGANDAGQLGNNTNSPSATPVVVARGDRLVGDQFVTIHAGGVRTCGRTQQNGGFCWGFGWGQVPTLPLSVELYHDIVPGLEHVCGVSAFDDILYCMGTNVKGQLGDGTVEPRALPVPVVGP